MAINGGKIEYTVGFKTDSSGLQTIKTQLAELSQMNQKDFFNINSSSFSNIDEAKTELQEVKKVIDQVSIEYDKAFDSTTGIVNINKLANALNKIGNDKISNSFNSMGVKGTQALQNINAQLTKANFKFKETNNFLSKMGETLTNTIKWGIASSAINKFTGAIQQAYGYVQHLDTSLNDIRIVTEKSSEEMDKFAVKANNAAKALGSSTTEYTEAALIYYQQGLSDEESQARAETTLKAANVTGQGAQAVSEQLTSVWNGYKVTAEETELYVDKLAAVAASTAADLEELSTGMSKVASAANNMGVDIDQLNAQLATIVSVTRQAPETAGTALKTIYARMEDLKIGGEDESGIKLGEVSSTLEAVGVSVMDTQGDLRDLGEVIEEVAGKWDTWTSAQQNAIAQALAGKRQYNNLLALFDNWDMYTDALETSKNATGTLQKQQDIYMESTAAHIQELKTEWEDLYDSLIDTDDINTIIDGVTSIVDTFTNFTDSIGGGKALLAGIVGVLGQIPGITSSISNQFGSIISKTLNAKLNTQEWANWQERVKKAAPNSETAKILQEMSQYAAILSDKDKEQISFHSEKIEKLSAEKELQDKILNDLIEQAKLVSTSMDQNSVIGEETKTEVDNINLDKGPLTSKQIEAVNFVFEEQEEQVEQLRNTVQSYIQDVEKLVTNQEEYNQALKQQDYSKMDKLEEEYRELHNHITDLRESMSTPLEILADNNPAEIQEIETKLIELDQTIGTTTDDTTELKTKLSSFKGVAVKDFNSLGQSVSSAKQQFSQLPNAINQTNEALQKARVDYKAFVQDIVANQVGQGITKTLAGLSSLAFSIQAIQNLGSIWKNEDASTGEKVLSTVTALATSLPMLVTGFSSLSSGFSILKTGLTDVTTLITQYSTSTEAAAIANKFLNGLNETQIKNLYGLEVAEAVAKNEINGETVSTILNTEAKSGNLAVSELLSTFIETKLTTAFIASKTAISATTAAIKTFLAANPAVVIASVALAVAKVATEIKEARAEAEAAAAENNLEISQSNYEDAKQYAEAVKEVASAYEDLKSQYESQELSLSNLRSKVYDLVTAHDVEVDAVDILTASYEELNQIMIDVSNQAVKTQNDAQKALIEAQKQNVIAQSEKYTSENASVLKDYGLGFLGNFDMAKTVQREAGINAMDVFGNIDWDIFYNASEDQRNTIISILEDYEAFNDRAKDALNTIRENQSAWDEAQATEKEYNKNVADAIYQQISEETEITDASSYNDVKEKLANQIATELSISYEQGLELAEKTLNNQEGLIKINAGFSLGEDLSESYGKSVESLANEINNLSTSDIDFLKGNIDLAKSYDSLNEFLETYEDIRDALQRKDNILKIQTVFTNADGEAFQSEDIADLFADQVFAEDFGQTQEEFENKTYEQQMSDLLTYYLTANKLESEYNASKKQNLLDEQEQKQKQLIQEKADLDSLKEKIIDTYNVSETALEEGYNNILNNSFETAAQNMNSAYGFDLMESDAGIDILEKYIQGKEELNDIEQEYIKYLAEANGVSVDQLNIIYNNIKAYEDFSEELENANIEGKSYTEIAEDIEKQLAEVESVITDIDLSDIDWGTFGDGVDKLIESTQNGIDELQSSYNSLTSVMEDYNETGTLTMDNLQTLLTMDTEYLSALQIENGQMSINEESLKQIALARLDEAEAEAYEQAMSELNDEARRREIESASIASTKLDNLGTAATNAAEAARNGVAAWNDYWSAALHENNVDNSDYAQQVGNALYNKLNAIESVRNQILSGDFSSTMSGSSSTSSSGSGGTEDEPDTEEYLEREEDLYKQINEQLEEVESTLGRIQTIDEHSWGINSKKALEEENELLKEQMTLYEHKNEVQKSDLADRQAELSAQGITFSDDGSVMTNTEDVLNSLYEEYNAMVDTYNAMNASEQETYKETLEAKKDSIDEIEDAIDSYEDAYNDYNDTLDDLLDTHYAIIENEVKQFTAEVEVHLELAEARNDWVDFWYDVVQDVEDTDFGKLIAKSMEKLDTYVGQEGTILSLTNEANIGLDEVQKQIANADNGGGDSIFGDDTELSKETLSTIRDNLIDAVTAAKEEIDNMSETYLDALDSIQDKLDEQAEGWENIGDHLNHNLEVLKLIDGEMAYDEINNQYQNILDNDEQLLEHRKNAAIIWEQEIQKYQELIETTNEATNPELYRTYEQALEKATENYKDAVKDLDSSLENAIKNVQSKRDNLMEKTLDTLDKAISNGIGIDNIDAEWDLLIKDQDMYLDNVERAFNMDDINDAFDELLNTQDSSLSKQQDLLKFRDEELAKLNEKNKLTQYDIDELKARIEIRKQEIALEDAQRNKSNLRLRRDSQGNYTYQYTANEDEIDEAENGIMSAKKDWYELVKSRNKEVRDEIIQNIRDIYDVEKEYSKAIAEGDVATAQSLLRQKEMLLERQKALNAEASKSTKDFYDGVVTYFEDVNNNTVLPMWQSDVSQMIDKWNNGGEDSFVGAVQAGITQLNSIQQEYLNNTEELFDAAGRSITDYRKDGIDPTTESLEDLQETNDDVNDSVQETIDLMDELGDALGEAEDAYNDLEASAVEAIEKINQTLKTLSETVVSTKKDMEDLSTASKQAATDVQNATNAKNTGGNSGNSGGTNTASTPKRTSKYQAVETGVGTKAIVLKTNKTDYIEMVPLRPTEAQKEFYRNKYNDTIDNLKSGGYTGSWNNGSNENNGKLAFLHQKELVLNESDTSNILNAVNSVRDLVNKGNSSIDHALANSLANAMTTQTRMMAEVGSQMLQAIASSVINNNQVQNYRNTTINADFSGVRSADAIYQALMNLDNYASQAAYSNAPDANRSY